MKPEATLAARAGDTALFAELALAVDKAYQQLEWSIENMAAKTQEFEHIPTDRPLLAMVVSAEPIYGGNAYLVEKHGASLSAGHLRNVPVAAVSARELAAMVTHSAGIEGILLEILQSHTTGTAFALRDIRAHSETPNSILEMLGVVTRFRRQTLGVAYREADYSARCRPAE